MSFEQPVEAPWTTAGASLRLIVAVIAVTPAMVTLLTSPADALLISLEAALLWALCLVPTWLYLRQPISRRRPIPLVPIIGLLYGLYYGLAPALGAYNAHWTIRVGSYGDYAEPVELALAGWLLLLAGYYGSGTLFSSSGRPRGPRLETGEVQFWGLTLLGVGLLAELAQRFFAIPLIFAGTLGFVAGLKWFGMVLLIVLAIRGRLSPIARLGLYAGIFVAGVLALGSGHAAQVARLLTGVLLAVWIVKRHLNRRWLLIALLGASLVVGIRGVAADFREQVWFTASDLSVFERAELSIDLLRTRIRNQGWARVFVDAGGVVLARSANMDLFADVVRRTPDDIPFWGGETYYSLVGAFVPRFIWTDKPVKRVGQAFGHRYGYLHPRDTTTSFNLPVLVEFYANFGVLGVFIGSVLLGFAYRALCAVINVPGQSIVLSAAAVSLFQPLLNIESGLSLSLGGLAMQGVALWLVLWTMRRFHEAGFRPGTDLTRPA